MPGKGHPRSFKDGKAFQDRFNEYLSDCKDNEYFPNIAGFCVFADITRETYYKQKEYYSDTFKKIENSLENTTLQDKNTTRAIFYLKNKFGYADKQEIESKNVNHNINEEVLSSEERKARIKELMEKNKNG
jgi:hypothetical protein